MNKLVDTEIGLLPKGWNVLELGDVADLINGYAFKSGDYASQGILNFRVVNIREQGLIDVTKDVEFLPQEFARTHKQYLLNEGDILIVMVGATRGKMAFIHKAILPALMNQNMWRILPTSKNEIDRRYLYYFLMTAVPKFVKGFSESARGFFKKADFRAIKIPLPSFHEQRKIAAVLRLVQQAMAQQERLRAQTAELKKALLHQLFTQGLRGEPQKQTDIGLVPESWEMVALQDVCTFRSGGTPSKQKAEFWQGSIPWVSPKDMKKPRLKDVADHISEAALDEGSSLAPSGSVFVVIGG
jgi:type I restriction enzyme S subunit